MKKHSPFFQKYSISKTKELLFSPFIKRASRRLTFISFLFCVAYSAVLFRLFDVMVLSKVGDEDKASTPLTEDPSTSVRANIYDRSKQMLATSIATYSMYANPKQVIDAKDSAQKIVGMFSELNYEEVKSKLESGKGFVWLKRNLPPQEQDAILKLGIPGIYFEKENKRVYLQGELSAHVVGLVNVDGKGIAGVEQTLDSVLVKNENPVELAMDLRIQHVLMDEIANSVAKFSAKGGGGLIMDIHTGEIVAIGSYPSFNPNQLANVNPDHMFNRITTGVYEYGSVMKILTSAMVLESEKADIYTVFDTTHPIKIGRFTITDYKGKHRPMPVWEVFLHSSNIGFVKMAQLVGVEGHKSFLRKMGLMDKPKLELSEIGRPLIPRDWREINTMTIAYGYGLSASPIQMARAMGAVINGGYMIEPTLLKRKKDEEVKKTRVISEQTSTLVKSLMRLVITDGTGKKAVAPGYEVFGKTGTANQQSGGKYHSNHVTTTFIGGFPFSNPKYLIMVTLDDPKATKETYGYTTAGWNAAELAGKTIQRIAPLVGITPVIDEGTRATDHMNLIQTKGILYENH